MCWPAYWQFIGDPMVRAQALLWLRATSTASDTWDTFTGANVLPVESGWPSWPFVPVPQHQTSPAEVNILILQGAGFALNVTPR